MISIARLDHSKYLKWNDNTGKINGVVSHDVNFNELLEKLDIRSSPRKPIMDQVIQEEDEEEEGEDYVEDQENKIPVSKTETKSIYKIPAKRLELNDIVSPIFLICSLVSV